MSASDIYKDWHVVDAADQPLGRVASEVAKLVVGKHKPTYEPHLDDGDYVIVLNAAKVRVTGRKREQMVYYRHSGYPGGLKSRSYDQQMERFPETILERAINGMLPKGSLGQQMRRHVKIYAGAEHPHHGQMAAMEKAVAERQTTAAEALNKSITSPKPPPRLRPLAVPQGTVAAEPAPAVEEKPKPKRRTAKKKADEAAVVVEADAGTEVEEKPKPKRRTAKKKADEAAVVVEADAGTEVEEKPKPKPRTTKKKAAEAAVVVEADAGTQVEEKPKPKPRTAKKKAAEAAVVVEADTGTEVEDKPKPKRRAAKKKAAPEASTEDKPAPKRRTRAKKADAAETTTETEG
jgi:large subunit ribosomal protein L13